MRRSRLIVLSAAVAAALLAPGCSWTVPRIGGRPPELGNETKDAEYAAVVAKYTRHREEFNRLDTNFYAYATHETLTFREARVRRAADFRTLPQPLVDKQLAEERAAAEATNEFFVALNFNQPRYDDLERPNTGWRLALLTTHGEVTPVKVERVGRTNANLRALYPYFDEFWIGYRLKFPKKFADGVDVMPEGTETVTLRVASALGNAEFHLPAK